MATTTITSASTFAEIEAEYLDTARYMVDDSLELAKRHVVAIKFMLLKIPTNTVKGGNSVSYSMSLMANELREAEKFVHTKELGGKRFIRSSFRNLRDRG